MPISAARLQEAKTHWPIIAALLIMAGVVIGTAVYYTVRLSYLEQAYVSRTDPNSPENIALRAQQAKIREAIQKAPTSDPARTRYGLFLVKTASNGSQEVIGNTCSNCLEDISVWEEWIIYPSISDTSNSLSAYIEAYNTKTKERRLVYSLPPREPDDDGYKDYVITSARVFGDQLFFTYHYWGKESKLGIIDLTSASWTPQFIWTGDEYRYPHIRIEYGQTWLVESYGDGCGGFGTRYVLDTASKQLTSYLEEGYGCQEGAEVITQLAEGKVIVGTHQDRDIQSQKSFGQGWVKVEAKSIYPPFDSTILLTESDLPEPITHFWYDEELESLVLTGTKSSYTYDPDTGALVTISVRFPASIMPTPLQETLDSFELSTGLKLVDRDNIQDDSLKTFKYLDN